MRIPDEAYEAGRRAVREHMLNHTGDDYESYPTDDDFNRVFLEAAAPLIAARAWDEGAQEAWSRSTSRVNGEFHNWRHAGEPHNPYRGEA